MGKLISDYQAEQQERFKKQQARREAKRAARMAQPVRIHKIAANGRTMKYGWAKEEIKMMRIMPQFKTKRQRKVYSRWKRGELTKAQYKHLMSKALEAAPLERLDVPEYAKVAEHPHHHHDHDGHHHH